MPALHDPKMRAMLMPEANALFSKDCLSKPVPRAGEVLVRIHASGVNPLDTKIRAGQAAHARHPLPAVLGMDLAGTVEALARAWRPSTWATRSTASPAA